MLNSDFVDNIVIRGARAHNLKNVSLSLPRNQLIVLTGVSGSGKSTLAFDTIYAEGQRRYVESLSAYARQFLGLMEKPDVESIEGLSPAISIDQKTTSHNPRSTVGTVTEIHDYLRLLYARAGTPYSTLTGQVVAKQSPSEITDRILGRPEGTRAMILAPLVRGRKGEYRKMLTDLKKEGFARVRIDGVIYEIAEAEKLKLEKYEQHDIDLVVDRITLKESDRARVAESIELAISKSEGLVRVFLPESNEDLLFSEKFACPQGGSVIEDMEPRYFSFNNPYGACPACTGLGKKMEFDPELMVPDTSLSVAEGAIAPWKGQDKVYYWDRLKALADYLEFDLKTPWLALDPKHQQAILHGLPEPFEVVHRHQGKETMRYQAEFEGVIPNLGRRYKETESDWMREKLAEFMHERPCPACAGSRYKPEVLAVRVAGLSLAEVSRFSVTEAKRFFSALVEGEAVALGAELLTRYRIVLPALAPAKQVGELSGFGAQVAAPIVREVLSRLSFLENVGLDYLMLERSANSLSGGEAQRIRLATQVGSGLTGVLYVLDEPSIGLHPKDNERLLATLKRLRDLGNTLIVVEHDEDTMREADWLVDMGPGAGIHGGEVVSEGTPAQVAADPASLTGAYLRHERFVALPKTRRRGNSRWLRVRGAREHNLKEVDLNIPLGTFSVITGPSGSGKSTLVHDILHAVLARELNHAKTAPGRYGSIEGLEFLDKVIEIDQSPIGRTPRSNPATYVGLFTDIRDLFTRAPEARKRGYGPGRFSFNVKGGRCEACEGDGTVRIEMNFLPDIYVPCEVCKGARYNRETLEVKIKGKNIAEVLDMTVDEGYDFFQNISNLERKLKLMQDVGLNYLRLGQSSPTLSGGEAQRVKLASELGKRATGKTIYILDEPTTGLHFEDVRKLLEVLQRLVDTGNTLVVIEHNLDVMKTADWIVDLGPEGGDRGGLIVCEGTPETIAAHPTSHTARFLAQALAFEGQRALATSKSKSKTRAKELVAGD
jgi:excinuclease ABC subunit A